MHNINWGRYGTMHIQCDLRSIDGPCQKDSVKFYLKLDAQYKLSILPACVSRCVSHSLGYSNASYKAVSKDEYLIAQVMLA